MKKSSEKKVLKCKGIIYEIQGEKVVFEKDGEKVELNLEFGKSAYSTVYLHLTKKSTKKSGYYKVGNFQYKIEESNLTVYNKKEEIIIEKLLEEKEMKYLRTTVINLLINTLE